MDGRHSASASAPESKQPQGKPTTIRYNDIHSRLTWAAAGNRSAVLVQTLENLPADDVNWTDGLFGNTALHWAVANSNTKIALLLLDTATNRIDFNTRDGTGKTALHLALGKGWEHFTDSEEKRATNELPQAPVIQRLIIEMEKATKKSQDSPNLLDAQDDFGYTPLHIAVIRRDIWSIDYLLKHGARQDIANKDGVTPRQLLETGTYDDARSFINKYVHVFTLPRETWEANLDEARGVLTHYPSQSPSAPVESTGSHNDPLKLALPSEALRPIPDSPTSLPKRSSQNLPPSLSRPPSGLITVPLTTPKHNGGDEKKDQASLINLDAPADVIFAQAILYLDHLTDQENTLEIEPKIKKSAQDFQAALRKLKKQSTQLSPDEQLILAKESLNLSKKVGSLAVDDEDIKAFHQATIGYRKTSKLGKALGALVGAALGLFVGVMIGVGGGPAAAFTGLAAGVQGAVIGASLGGLIGAGLGFWASKSILQTTHSLMQMNRAAGKIALEMKPRS